MALNHVEFSSPKPKMAERPKYALPLVVRYQNLIALIREDMRLAVKDSVRG